MNKQEKQELIEWINKFSVTTHTALGRIVSINTDVLVNKIQQIDEPQKVKVNQYVAEWYEEHKHNLSNSLWEFTAELNEKTLVTGAIYTEFESWFIDHPRAYEVITSMENGYEVEESKWVVNEGDLVIRKGEHEAKVYFVESVDDDGILLVNGIKDEFFTDGPERAVDEETLSYFYGNFRLLAKKESLEVEKV